MHEIPYGRQTIGEDDIEAVAEVLRSDFLTTGPKVSEFESRVAAYSGARYAAAVSNGTAALHLACMAAGIEESDEVITSPITFAASANCVRYCGATPVFADIDPVTYNLDPDDVEKKITERTKAIIPVHFTGQPCDMDRIHRIAKEHHLLVIEDAAHAIGAEYRGKKIGGLSDMATFSFHPVKNMTTGEGGMILTDNQGFYEKLLLLRTHGITRKKQLLMEDHGSWYYEQLALGYNYRMTDIQAALGISQLKKLDSFLERRRTLVSRYNTAFGEMEELVLPQQAADVCSSWHLYVIQVQKEKRKRVFEGLRACGIGVNVHYIPVYTFPYYREHGYQDVVCENSEKLYERMITLPLYPGLQEKEQDYVIQKVKQLVCCEYN